MPVPPSAAATAFPTTIPITPTAAPATIGEHVRQWRMLRRMTQFDLADQAALSTRHLSCVETGRAEPSRELVLRLAQCLSVPIRERNTWLTAAGFAPMYRDRALDHADMAPARRAMELLLTCHEPFPAIAMDGHWNIVSTNRTTARVLAGANAPQLVQGANVIRLCHSPGSPLAPSIANLAQLRQHHIRRLQQQIATTADPVLRSLLGELKAYPCPPTPHSTTFSDERMAVAAPLQIRSTQGVLSFFTASTVFGSAHDITLSELAMELFLPADAFTSEAVPRMMEESLS